MVKRSEIGFTYFCKHWYFSTVASDLLTKYKYKCALSGIIAPKGWKWKHSGGKPIKGSETRIREQTDIKKDLQK